MARGDEVPLDRADRDLTRRSYDTSFLAAPQVAADQLVRDYEEQDNPCRTNDHPFDGVEQIWMLGQALAHAFARRNIDVTVASRRAPEALAPQARAIGPTVVASRISSTLSTNKNNQQKELTT